MTDFSLAKSHCHTNADLLQPFPLWVWHLNGYSHGTGNIGKNHHLGPAAIKDRY